MTKVWKDYPDTTTPLTAAELNRLEKALEVLAVQAVDLRGRIDTLESDTGWLSVPEWKSDWGSPIKYRVKHGICYVMGLIVRTIPKGKTQAIGVLPVGARPNSRVAIMNGAGIVSATPDRGYSIEVTVETDGKIGIANSGSSVSLVDVSVNFLVD